MNKKSILVVSNQQGEHNSLHDWLSDTHPFHVNTAPNDEAAIELFHRHRFDLVIVDGTDHTINEKKLHAVLPVLQEDVLVLEYQGETSYDLDDQITAAFESRKYARLQRMLLLEPSTDNHWDLPPFSLN
ncbi:MAG: hypothetical protein INR73_00005 [Williamsia sp.]|nr:hypothetical protein [Williamsia sp.]